MLLYFVYMLHKIRVRSIWRIFLLEDKYFIEKHKIEFTQDRERKHIFSLSD